MIEKNKKMNIIQYSKSMNKNLRFLNRNHNLNELLQDINNINNNILKYKQIENLLKSKRNKDLEKKSNEKNSEKTPLLQDMKLLQNRLYRTKKETKVENNIKYYKNNFKDVMKEIFGKSDSQKKIRYFPKSKTKLKHIKYINDMNINLSEGELKREHLETQTSNKNNCITERDINDKMKEIILKNNKTIENNKTTHINFMDYASNCVKYKHPQFYLLNINKNNKKILPPIKKKKVKMIDLFPKDNSFFKKDIKKSKFEKYMLALQLAGIAKFKIND